MGADGLRWAHSAGAGPGRAGLQGRGRRAPLGRSGPDGGRPAAPRRALGRRDTPGGFRFSRGGCPALWGTGHRDGDGGGWSRLRPWSGPGPAAARPARAEPLRLRPGPAHPAGQEARPRLGAGHRLLTWAARTRGAVAAAGARAGPGRAVEAGLQRAPWGRALGSSWGAVPSEDVGRVDGIRFPGPSPPPLGFGSCPQSY